MLQRHTKSGSRCEILRAGVGGICTHRLNYTAKLASTGAVFDSTYQRRQPLVIKVRLPSTACLRQQEASNVVDEQTFQPQGAEFVLSLRACGIFFDSQLLD